MAPILSIVEAKSFMESNRYLLCTPNVVSLGFSNEKVNGEKTGGKIFRVGVIKKQSKENIKDPDIFIPKFVQHTKTNSNEVVYVPVEIVEEGELQLLVSDKDNPNPGNGPPYKGASLVKIAAFEHGCLGANALYDGSYRLLTAAHVLTKFDRKYTGSEILVRNNEGVYVEIGAEVTSQVDVVLYDTSVPNVTPEYARQDLAWANIDESKGSPEIEAIGIPTKIRRVKEGEYVKYHAGNTADLGSMVEVEDVLTSAKVPVEFCIRGRKYGFFKDICRIEPLGHLMDEGDSGTAIVAEDDNALLGILIAKTKTAYYFCKLELD